MSFRPNIMAWAGFSNSDRSITMQPFFFTEDYFFSANERGALNDITSIEGETERKTKSPPREASVKELAFQFSYDFAGNGGRMRELNKLSAWLAEAAADADKALISAQANLVSQILQSQGMSSENIKHRRFNDLSPELQKEMRDNMMMNYQEYGFESEQEGLDFLERSNGTGITYKLMVSIQYVDNGVRGALEFPLGSYMGN